MNARWFMLPYLAASLLCLVLYLRYASPVLLDQAPRGWGYVAVAAGAAAAIATVCLFAPKLHAARRFIGATLLLLAVVGGAALGKTPFAAALWQGSFLSPIDALLLALGAAVLLRGPRPTLAAPRLLVLVFLLIGAAVYLALFYRYTLRMEETPLHLWADRRLLPIVLPLLALAEAWALMRLLAFTTARLRPLAAVVAVALLLAARWSNIVPIVATREYAGALEATRSVARQMEPDAVILLDNDATGIRLSAPLRFLEGRSAYILHRPSDAGGLRALLAAAKTQGRRVYYLASRDTPSPILVNPHTEVARFRFPLPELERTSAHRPQAAYIYLMEGVLYLID